MCCTLRSVSRFENLVRSQVLPMLVQPLPWPSMNKSKSAPSGGYLTVRSNMMRTKQGGLREQSRALKEADLRPMFQARHAFSLRLSPAMM